MIYPLDKIRLPLPNPGDRVVVKRGISGFAHRTGNVTDKAWVGSDARLRPIVLFDNGELAVIDSRYLIVITSGPLLN